MRWTLGWMALWFIGCAETQTVRCGDVICPPQSTCGPENECIPYLCGNEQVDGREACDSSTLLSCTDQGFYEGTLVCGATCELDTSGCSLFCGDHATNGPENCDGLPPPGTSCADFGFDVGALGCSGTCTLALDHCNAIGWRESPGTTDRDLRAVWQTGPNSGFAVGDGGTIMSEVDGVWTEMISPTTEDLHALYFAKPAAAAPQLFAVGANGTVLRYDGTTWTKQPVPAGTPSLNSIDGVSDTAIVVVGDGGTILRYDGTSWSKIASGTSVNLHGVWVGASAAYAVGDDYTLLEGTPGGGWTAKATPVAGRDLYAVFGVPSSPLELYIGGLSVDATYTGFYRYTAASGLMKADVPAEVTPSTRLRAAWGTGGLHVYLAGDKGQLLHWNGHKLTSVDSPTSRTIHDLHGIGPGQMIAAASGGKVLEYKGTDVERQTLAGSELRSAARYWPPGYSYFPTVVAGTARGTVIRETPSGWAAQAIGSRGDAVVNGLWIDGSLATSATDVYAAAGEDTDASEAGVWRSVNGAAFTRVASGGGANALYGVSQPALQIVAVGKTVQKLSAGTWATVTAPNGTHVLHAVFATPDGDWFAVGEKGYAMHDPGTGWVAIEAANVPDDLYGVWGSAANNVYAVGQHGRLLHWNGTAWRQLHSGTGENLVSISGTSASDIFATGSSGEIIHFDGVGWSRMNGLAGDIHAVSASFDETLFVNSDGVMERLLRKALPTENRCVDAWDNDGNGMTNCDDDACADDASCKRGGACETSEPVTCGTVDLATSTYSGVARLDDVPCLDHSTPGPEASYRFVATTTGPVTVTVADDSNQTELVVLDARAVVRNGSTTYAGCELGTCRAATHASGTQAVTFDAEADHTYYIVVDTTPLYVGVPFTLSVSCTSS
jgi:hypothetical protein